MIIGVEIRVEKVFNGSKSIDPGARSETVTVQQVHYLERHEARREAKYICIARLGG